MDLLFVVDLSAHALHEMRKRLWQKRFGFPVPNGLVFRQHCSHDQCTEVDHLYLVELATKPMRRLWKRAGAAGPSGWNRGASNVKAKLDERRVAAIRESHARGASVGVLALVHGLNETTVRRILRRKIWT